MSGRPLRFFGASALGWVALRTFMLWPSAGPDALPHALIAPALADDAPAATAVSPATAPPPRILLPAVKQVARYVQPLAAIGPRTTAQPVPIVQSFEASTAPAATSLVFAPVSVPQTLLAPPPATAPPSRIAASRWSASAWFVLRDGRGIAPGLGGGQLGGGQAGLRIAYALGEAGRVAIVGRVASPLAGKGREAALGIEWRPTKLPVRLVAEYRAALDGGGSGPAAGVIAGTGPAPLALGFDLETYGQAGVIRRRRTEPFADGAARLSHPLARIGAVKLDLGLGGWGAAQRDAQRLDLGPSLGIRVPLAGKSLRLSLDWRQRVAGDARPGSGPVLVIGSDF